MRIGLFGGTFDPIHLGHLIVAEQCREQARLDEVWFVPAARPPHKKQLDLTHFDRRAEMIQLAIAGQPLFRLCDIEKHRPGPSYTAETLSELRRTHPEVTWHLILGADALTDLPQWYDPIRIVTQAVLLVVARPGWELPPSDRFRHQLQLKPDDFFVMSRVESPLIDISSRDLRLRVAQGRSIRYMVPAAVAAYIDDKGLYHS
jgi:nicotinate-nucleotide adenylyltransferase